MGWKQELVTKIKNNTLTKCDVNALSEQQLKTPVLTDGGTLLHVAAQLGTTQMLNWIKSALKAQAAKQCAMPKDDGWTPLHIVARYQDSTAVKAMLAALGPEAAKVCAMPNNAGWTPLHFVTRYQDSAAVKRMLVALGPAAPNVCAMPKKNGWTPLHFVARHQDSAAVEAMLAALGSETAKVCAMPNNAGWTPLHFVTRYQDSTAVRGMLAALGPAAPNVCAMPKKDGWTPLHLVACYQDSVVVKAMLAALGPKAANVCAMPNNTGSTPLHMVAHHQDSTAVKAMLAALGPNGANVCAMPDKDGWTPLHMVAHYQDSTAVKLMLAALGPQAPVVCAMPKKDGWTPLHHIARNKFGKLECSVLTAMLAALGTEAAKVCAMPEKNGWTPLHMVTQYHDSAAVKGMLAALGPEVANVCAMPEKDGCSPLHLVASNQSGKLDSKVLTVMLAALGPEAANVCAMPNKNGWTPLHQVARNQSGKLDVSALKTILAVLGPQAKRVLALKTNDGDTPQMLSQWADKSSGIKAVLANPEPYLCSISILPQLDVSSYAQMAAKIGNVESLIWLQTQHGLKATTIRDNQDNTLLHLAAADGHGAAVKWLLNAGIDPMATNGAFKTAQEVATGEALTVLTEALKSKPNEATSSTSPVSKPPSKLVSKPLPKLTPKSKPLPRLDSVLYQATALGSYDNQGDRDYLSFKTGEVLEVLTQPDANGWQRCRLQGCIGLAPGNYLEQKERDSRPRPHPVTKPHQGGGSRIDEQGHMRINLLIPYEELAFAKKLGQGGFGTVHEGTLQDHTQVAIKKLLLDRLTERAEEEFKNEAAIMAELRHPNLVALYGIVLQPEYCMVMELLENGSLYSVLHSKRALDWDLRQRIALDMSRGLAFLHSKKILHRDLKSLNVLLDSNMRAKLADFGLSLVRAETKSKTTKKSSDTPTAGAAGTLRWMAPELFRRRAQYTPVCDIYSLAMTLWELAARKIPFSDAVDNSLVQKWVQEGEREDIPVDCPEHLTTLITQSWSETPTERPSALAIVQRLQAAMASQSRSSERTPGDNPAPSYRGNTASSSHVVGTGYRPNTGGGDTSTSSGYRGNVSTLPSQGSYRPSVSEETSGDYSMNSGVDY